MWAKVDMARLLVLQHCLRDARCKVAVYSDLDVPDVLIKSEAFKKRIDEYGIALGGTIEPDTGKIFAPYENGYAAFSKKASPILEHMLEVVSNTMKRVAPAHYTFRDSIFLDVRHALFDWSRDHHDTFPISAWQNLVGGLPALYPMGFRGDTHLIAKPRPSSRYAAAKRTNTGPVRESKPSELRS